MTLILSALILVALICLLIKYWTFSPEVNIYYLVKLFNTYYRSIAIVGEDEDKSPLALLLRPFEKVEPFMFKFQKLVTKVEATEKNWLITFEILNDKKVIVEREEMVPGWLAIELHAVGIEFVTTNGIDMSLVLECAYQPLEGDGPILMKKKVKNWSAFADMHIQNIVSAWGRQKNDDTVVLKANIDTIMCDIAGDIFPENVQPDAKRQVIDYLNTIFKAKGFKLVNTTLYKVVNGPQSQDVKNQREAIKIADLSLQKADLDAKAAYKKLIPALIIKKKTLDLEAGYVERVNKSIDLTAAKVSYNLRNIKTFVGDPTGKSFSTKTFVSSKVAQQQKGGDDE